jgi:hypothetical protein
VVVGVAIMLLWEIQLPLYLRDDERNIGDKKKMPEKT